MYKHVLCVYPYRTELGRDAYFPPLGLECIAGVFEKHAESIDVVDLRRETKRTVDFLRPETDLVAFSVNWDCEGPFVRDEIRSVPSRVLTVVGGRHATNDPEAILADCRNVDILVRGDGEEVVEEIAVGSPLGGIAGISFRNGKAPDSRSGICHNPVRQPGPARDDLWPNRRLRRYEYPLGIEGFSSHMTLDSVASSRGCPFSCTYCSFSRNPWGTKRGWSARSPESVVNELEEIDADVVAFTDDNFTHDMDRVERICDLIVARGIRKRYLVNARLEIARRPDVIRKMERAGFSMLLLGIESTQDRTLLSMRKGFDTAKVREYFRVLRRSRMLLHGYFIIGNIGETEREMLYTSRFAHELGIDSLGLCILRDSPHSGMADLVAASPGYHIDAARRVYSDKYSSGHLRQLRRRINRQFYTMGHVVHVLKKALRNKAMTPLMMVSLPAFLIYKGIQHGLRKAFR
ncbi:MAG: B12-binding domain-containing radical SAM protein [Planctomycetota bacterium]